MSPPIQPQDLDRLVDRVCHALTFTEAAERVLRDALEILEADDDE